MTVQAEMKLPETGFSRSFRDEIQPKDMDFLKYVWYNNEENAGHACMNRHLTSISIETLVEMAE